MPSIGARSLVGGEGAGKKGGPRIGKCHGIDPATGLPRTCFRYGSDERMVGPCLEPKGKGKGNGETTLMGLAYGDHLHHRDCLPRCDPPWRF
ncbi:hypothetical protein N9L68_02065 [bacterium]|nr:hypothetical protein [bacterium]